MSKIKKVALGEVCDVRDGTHDSPKYVNEGYPFITSKNIKNGRIDFSDIKYITKEDFDKINQRSYVDNGDIIMPMIGTIGNPVVVNKDREFAIKNVTLIKFNKNSEIYNKFLQNYLSYYFNRNINYEAGSTLKFISLSEIRNILIPLPPLPIQQQIAARLEKADELRRMRRYAIEMSERFLQEVFIDMFGDPVKNPKGWEEKRLEDICTKITDGTHNSPPITSKGKPYITAKHVKENKIDFYLDPWYISKEDHDLIYKRCKPERGDILYIKDGATTGIAAINPYDFEFSMLSSLALLKPNNKVTNATYICAWLNNDYIKKIILKDMAGGAIKRLTLDKIQNIKIFLPPLKNQMKFSSIINYFNKNLSQQREALRQSELLFSALLNEAFSE